MEVSRRSRINGEVVKILGLLLRKAYRDIVIKLVSMTLKIPKVVFRSDEGAQAVKQKKRANKKPKLATVCRFMASLGMKPSVVVY